MKVTFIAGTYFETPQHVGWEPNVLEATDPESLIEFAGRACYQSWSRPNPKTASNKDYIANILAQEHYSVLEHANATFYIEGVSRSLTHELIRHRHFSYSQLSQRFVDEGDAEFVTPPALDKSETSILNEAFDIATLTYREVVGVLQRRGLPRKQAREAARAVLPNAIETKIVVTGNYRAWREFIDKRATGGADLEINRLAIAILRDLQMVAPNVFSDYTIHTQSDGREVV